VLRIATVSEVDALPLEENRRQVWEW